MSETYKATSVEITSTISRFREEVLMWRDQCGKLNIELQAEQQKRIWFENRYNEILRALQILQEAQKPKRENFCEIHNCNYVLSGYCTICHPNGI